MPSKTFIASKEKSMPGLNISQNRVTLFLGSNVIGDLKLKLMLFYHLENLGTLKNYARFILLCSPSGKTKPGLQHICSLHGLLNSLSLLWRTTIIKKKKNPFKVILLTDSAPGKLRILVEMYNKIQVPFMPTDINSFVTQIKK